MTRRHGDTETRGFGNVAVSPFPRFPVSLFSREAGFTLLELMISIALIGVIVLIVGGAMRLGFRSVESGARKIDSLERIRTSLNIVDSQVQSEIPLTITDDTGTKYSFTGEKDSISFSTNYSIFGGEKGYVNVTYTVVTDSSGKKSLNATESIVGLEESREVKLFDSFDDISFEYFYKGPTDENGQWVEQWTDETSIPPKIKLHLVNARKDISMIIPMRSKGALVPGASVQG